MSQFFNANEYIVSAVKGLRKQQETEPVSFSDSGEAMSFALNTLDSFRTLGIKGVSVKIRAVGNGQSTLMVISGDYGKHMAVAQTTNGETDQPADTETS